MQEANIKLFTENINKTIIVQSNINEYSVAEISGIIKKTIETNFDYVRVRGEISGLKIASSGHVYFNLKDNNSILACTCWKPAFAKLPVKPEEGLEVVATGKITTYAGQSKYQMSVDFIEIGGVGVLMQRFEKLKAMFLAEGVFDKSRKVPLPFLPQIVGIVTSLSGSVISDIIHRVRGRCPTRIIINPVTVQGNKAAQEISDAIRDFNESPFIPKPDIIIIARGGGSIEDLWAFNEEIVVRSISNSHIPIISAVGHETDFTLADFAADVRAPTPTAAAEFALPVFNDLCLSINSLKYRLLNASYSYFKIKEQTIKLHEKSLPTSEEIIALNVQKLDHLVSKLQGSITKFLKIESVKLELHSLGKANLLQFLAFKRQKLLNYSSILSSFSRRNIKEAENRFRYYSPDFTQKILWKFYDSLLKNFSNLLEGLDAKNYLLKLENNIGFYSTLLESFDYHNTLKRGFAIIRAENGKIFKSSTEVLEDADIKIEMYDGILKAKLKGISKK